MRLIRVIAGCYLLLALATVQGQPVPYETTVIADTEVRSGPSPMYYATGKLQRGAPVRVVAEKEGGWLAIEPPAGSFSWINGRLLGKHTGQTAVVLSPEAPVLAGSSLLDRQPDVVSTKLPEGSQVVILGESRVLADNSKWWPIMPQKEFRYLRKEAVMSKTAVEAVGKSPGPAAGPGPLPSDPLWLQAEQAREAGRIAEARQFYEACLRQPNLNDGLRWRCLERLQQLAGAPGPAQPAPAPVAAPPGKPAVDFRSPLGVAPAPAPPLPGPNKQGQAVGYGPRPGAVAGGQTFGPGRLRRAGFFIDGKQAYALEDSQGRLMMYVTPQGGLNLEAHINRNIELGGAMTYHQQLRKDYLLATQVVPLPY